MSSYLAGLLFLDVKACREVEQACLKELARLEDALYSLRQEQKARTDRQTRQQEQAAGARARAAGYAEERRQHRASVRDQTGQTDQTAGTPPAPAGTSGSGSRPGKMAPPAPARSSWRESLRAAAAPARREAKNAVSLAPKRQEDLPRAEWADFAARLQRLRQSEDPDLRRQADALEQERRKCPPMGQRSFLERQGDRLAALEARQAAFQARQAGRQELDARYRALCRLLEEQPDPAVLADGELCRRQTEEMWKRLSRRRQHAYMVRTLREVFALHGIPLETEQEEDPAPEVLVPLGRSARLVVSRSSGGAFEMEVEGLCAAPEPTEDERREALEQAVAFCRLYPRIEADLAARGVHLADRVTREPEQLRFAPEAGQDRTRYRGDQAPRAQEE